MKIFKKHHKKDKFWKHEFNALAGYNSEVARGIVHTDEWKKKMKRLQEEYNERIPVYYSTDTSPKFYRDCGESLQE